MSEEERAIPRDPPPVGRVARVAAAWATHARALRALLATRQTDGVEDVLLETFAALLEASEIPEEGQMADWLARTARFHQRAWLWRLKRVHRPTPTHRVLQLTPYRLIQLKEVLHVVESLDEIDQIIFHEHWGMGERRSSAIAAVLASRGFPMTDRAVRKRRATLLERIVALLESPDVR